MRVTVNGTSRAAVPGQSVEQLVAEVAADRRGVAVAVNGEVVPRTRWAGTALSDGDLVEVLAAAQGG